MKNITLALLILIAGCESSTNNSEIKAYVSWEFLGMPIDTEELKETEQELLHNQKPHNFRNSGHVFYNCFLNAELLRKELSRAKKTTQKNHDVVFNTYFKYKNKTYLVKNNTLSVDGIYYEIPVDFNFEMKKMKETFPDYERLNKNTKRADIIKEFYLEHKLGTMCELNLEDGWREIVPEGLVF